MVQNSILFPQDLKMEALFCVSAGNTFFSTCVNITYAQNNQKHDLSKQQSEQAKTG